MKPLLKSIPLLFIALISQAQNKPSSLPDYWERGGTVYYLARTQLTYQILPVKESDASWAYLEIRADYATSFKDQLDALRQARPGLKYERVLGKGAGDVFISIPQIGIERAAAQWIPRINGPAAVFSFLISKTQTETIQNASKLLIHVKGDVEVSIPKIMPIETLTVSKEECKSFFSQGNQLMDVVLQTDRVRKKIKKLSPKYEETVDLALSHLLNECIDLENISTSNNFQELLSVGLKPKDKAGDITVSLIKEVFQTEKVNFTPNSTQVEIH